MKLEDYGAMSKMDDAIASADEMLRDIELLEARMNARSENFQNFLLETAMTSASVDYEDSIEKCLRARDQAELDMDKAWVQLIAAYDDAMDSELSESDTGESVMDEEDVPDIDEEGFKRPFPVARPGCPFASQRRKPHQLPKQIRPTSIGAFGDLMSDDSPTSSDDEDILDSPTSSPSPSSPSPASPSSDAEDSTTGSSKEADITLSEVDNVSATIANTASIATTASATAIPASNTSATSSSNFNSASTHSHQTSDPEPILEAVDEEEYVLDLSMPKPV